MQAVEQYEAVKEREREQVAELEEARSTAKAATSRFHGLKEERCSLFMAAFQHVADIIDTVYTVRLSTVASTLLSLATADYSCPLVHKSTFIRVSRVLQDLQ